jgi:HEPN domain-containing protein
MANRAADWLNQALRDLEQAEQSRTTGHHEWACFAVQQAAEKAVKALHLHLGQESWGHVVARALRELPKSARPPESLVASAQVLDTAYIPSRCPNSNPEGAPFEHYGPIYPVATV